MATAKPTGLTIARNGMKFTLSWKIADKNYDAGLLLQYRTFIGKWTKWSTIQTPNKKATAASVTLNAADYFPRKNVWLYGISFRLCAKREGYAWSAYSTCTMDLTAPETPSLTANMSEMHSNVATFTWTTPNVSNTNLKPFTDVEWQTILVKESNVTDGSKLPWKSSTLGWATGTGSASGGISRTEDTALLAQNSYTRWVRVRARGCGGNGKVKGLSFWRYAKHVYARPYAPVVNTASIQMGAVKWVSMDWTANADAAHPIDAVVAQWAVATPLEGLQVPSGATWNDVTTIRDTSGRDAVKFAVDDPPSTDECLWVRVVVVHDSIERPSAPYYVYGGSLATPSGLTVTTNDSTFRATVTATNNSAVPDSDMAVVYRRSGKADVIVGFIEHGETSITVQCPDWSKETAVAFGVYAFQGNAIAKGRLFGSTYSYGVEANLRSPAVWDGGAVPLAPAEVTVNQSDTPGEVILTWAWTWTYADQTEISWSQNPNAWESTEEPSTYTVTNLNAALWRVAGLAVGTTWYFRLRFGRTNDEDVTYGPYSETVSIDLSSAPNKPILSLTRSVIRKTGDSFTASWTYASTDGTAQAYAEIKEVTVSEDVVTYGQTVATTTTARHYTFKKALTGWNTGSTHYLAVRTNSRSGHASAWSDPIPIAVAEPISINVGVNSFVSAQIDDGDGGTRTVTALTAMPIEVEVTGAGEGGMTAVVIERGATYEMDRPDESRYNGWDGEAVCIYTQPGEVDTTLTREDLIGTLDDGAPYRLIATVQDTYGQSATEVIDFEVHWAHQALIPEGRVTIGDGVALIRPIAPEGFTAGDTCDVYRLSTDKPVKVLEGAEFGTAYIDPYPTIGETGGYRFVYVTVEGDYITEDNTLAWTDIPAGVDSQKTIIDFDSRRVELAYDMRVSHTWEKDFTETAYLGGSVQGDWNLAIHRSATVGADVVTNDRALIEDMRRLAAYPGICHVRTVDGSSFAANVTVTEDRSYERAGKVAAFSLTITRVDGQGLDGVTYEEWEA